MKPQAILIEDDLLDAEMERFTLEQAGFDVVHAQSLLNGETYITRLLDIHTPYIPTAIVLDLRMPNQTHPDLEGTTLAAVVTRRTQAALLHPTLLVALTNYLSQEREEEAFYAGCHHVMPKPLTHTLATWLYQRVFQPLPPLEVHSPGVRLYQKQAEEILALISRGQPPDTWTAYDVELLLSALTSYAAPEPPDGMRQRAVLLAFGGQHAAAARLRACVQHIGEPYDYILAAYLDGCDRRAVREGLIAKGYSRTHSYYCINQLSQRVNVCLEYPGFAPKDTTNSER